MSEMPSEAPPNSVASVNEDQRSNAARFASIAAWGLLCTGVLLLILFSLYLIRAQKDVEAALVRVEALGTGGALADVDAALGPTALKRYMRDEWLYAYRLHGSFQAIELQVDAPQGVVQDITIRTFGSPLLPLSEWHRIVVRNPVNDAMILCIILAFPTEAVLGVRLLLRRRPLWTPWVVLAVGYVQVFWVLVTLVKIRYGD